ncbi:Archaeal primase DnaG/twinkle, TOPRIM domain [uncultured Caudovirales phage]|uniref:Archaeal primase DnaG/twinkle, TOPRIM domain n=1 Tax=uncultured Caudovirales phage TaxID=2100421 RepID=A0A6J5Q547_9CAUD|nr:Archaeal primase DnaG/twinkle, TOPRIM domain [uncultured Caudovirales phage]CAB4184305.1 Archaeal primase DnaG/twinkle, TOPRIM domain [uncultured Caudovirales phage]CAB4202822.1 Archaeal primase DnaG/twinkle, TOPRIM domain [uncultured Caudovirales phage]CAB4215059.1 Archaeal primase DnaG/twinkle, TOPRIM domain [uncultured Caudovirales phage]CAB5230191.1 Archaeal primase DnaG/twinkle, TOPRIM domain [uncultured Caudovirales phage]
MTSLLDILGGAFVPVDSSRDKHLQLASAIMDSGLDAPSEIIFDGELRRFSSGQGGRLSCWVVAYESPFMAYAVYGNWKDSSTHTWRENIGRTLTLIEDSEHKRAVAAAKVLRDEAFAIKREEAAETATALYLRATKADDSHPYLVSKGIKANGSMVAGDGSLVIPVYQGGDKVLSSVQFIGADGSKRFLTGGAIKGGWHIIGSLVNVKQVFIAEGFATACSIREATGKPCIVAFNAGNLPTVAIAVRDRVGLTCSITICADMDVSGIGEAKAREAAALIGANVAISPTSSDFNDAANAGIDIVSILMPEAKQEWLIHADDMVNSQITVRWLVKGWIPRDSLIMLHGPSGSGKSLVVLDMVARVASSLDDWQGHKVRHGQVIYLAGEGWIGMSKRIRAWREVNSVDSLDMWVSKAGCDLNSPEGYRLARDAIIAIKKDNIKPAVIVVDTLHRFMAGDENSAQDAGEMIKACGGLMAEFNCSVLLVHHTGVAEGAQGRARGSSAWKGAMESEISIVPQTETEPLEIVNVKAKDDAMSPKKFMRIHGHIFENWLDEDGDPVSGGYVSEADEVKKVSKTDDSDRKSFTEILKKVGKKLEDGRMFVSENDWSDATIDENGVKTAALRNQRARIKKRMVDSGDIIPVTNGYAANFEMILL